MRRLDFHFDGLICTYNVTKQIKQLNELILHNYNVECNANGFDTEVPESCYLLIPQDSVAVNTLYPDICVCKLADYG